MMCEKWDEVVRVADLLTAEPNSQQIIHPHTFLFYAPCRVTEMFVAMFFANICLYKWNQTLEVCLDSFGDNFE